MPDTGPRHEPCGDGIRRDHLATCKGGTSCRCPYTYWLPRDGRRTRRRARVYGTLDDARRAKTTAHKAARQRRRERANQQAGAAPIPVLDAWHAQLVQREWQQVRISTRDKREVDYTQRIGPHLGRRKLDRITTGIVKTWLYDLIDADGNRPCVQDAHDTLCKMLDDAVTAGLIHTNPARAVPYPTGGLKQRQLRTLAHPAYRHLLDTCRRLDERCAVRLLTEPALRISEAVELRIGDLDLDACTIHVQRRAYHARSGAVDIDTPKNHKPRLLPIPKSLVADLRAYLAQRPDLGPDNHVLTRCSAWTKHEHLPHTIASLRNQIYRLARRAGLDGVSPHRLRASGLTIAVHAGTPLVIAQAIAGHSRIQTTMAYVGAPDVAVLKGYADVFEDLGEAA